MEPSTRFTAAEGGARLAAAASAKNTLATEYSSFISTRLVYEDAYKIRGPLSSGYQRSVYVTRSSRLRVVAHELALLTDLTVIICHSDSQDTELEDAQVLVCTSSALQRLLDDKMLTVAEINVLVLDSCHLINTDPCLRSIMDHYKKCEEDKRPRILALTYPLFQSNRKESDTSSTTENIPELDKNLNNESKVTENQLNIQDESLKSEKIIAIDKTKSTNDKTDNIDTKNNSVIDSDLNKDNDAIENKNLVTDKTESNMDTTDNTQPKCDTNDIEKDSIVSKIKDNTKSDNGDDTIDHKKNLDSKSDFKDGVYENLDDFELYEKLEWKIEELENSLCCLIDLAEDIDGGKRLSATLAKPKELIIEYSSPPPLDKVPDSYADLDTYMRETVRDAMDFICDHRYDPTEIYGEDMFEEFKNIPDPTIDPKRVFQQFIYVLDELGPYAADKAAFALLTKLEKLKIKVPYERHFLLLCLCTSVFVKIRCYAEYIFSRHESDWEKVQVFSTPKVLRFAEVLEKFQPPEQRDKSVKNVNLTDTKSDSTVKTPDRTDIHDSNVSVKLGDSAITLAREDKNVTDNTKKIDININELTDISDRCIKAGDTANSEDMLETDVTEVKTIKSDTNVKSNAMLQAIEECDFLTLSDKIEDRLNTLEANLKDLDDYGDTQDRTVIGDAQKDSKDAQKDSKVAQKDSKVAQKDSKDAQNEPVMLDSKTNIPMNTESTAHIDSKTLDVQKGILGIRRQNRSRGRGRPQRHNAMRMLQLQQNPDALCGIVFMRDSLVAKVMFMIIVDMSRANPRLSYLCAQYCGDGDTSEPKECQRQGKKQEEVLKKFRMHECNILLATPALEEGIDLPRCNLVLRWDLPASYRSYGLCRGRARASRAASAVLCTPSACHTLLQHLSIYTELDQIISRKCGCGIQDEPPQEEEDHADSYTRFVTPYTPNDFTASDDKSRTSDDRSRTCNDRSRTCNDRSRTCNDRSKTSGGKHFENRICNDKIESSECKNFSSNNKSETGKRRKNKNEIECSNEKRLCSKGESVASDDKSENSDTKSETDSEKSKKYDEKITNSEICYSKSDNNDDKSENNDKKFSTNKNNETKDKEVIKNWDNSKTNEPTNNLNNKKCIDFDTNKKSDKKPEEIASVDLSSAVALINRYCGKLPSDTFTRLAPQWWMERVRFPAESGERVAYICTLRLPLNCPIKYNIVGHPMPTRVLARRMVALRACAILHKAGELDDQLMPIGKENFKAVEPDTNTMGSTIGCPTNDPGDSARPGTTKRRQYYYKRTAWAFTDCQPVIDTSDTEIDPFKTTEDVTHKRNSNEDISEDIQTCKHVEESINTSKDTETNPKIKAVSHDRIYDFTKENCDIRIEKEDTERDECAYKKTDTVKQDAAKNIDTNETELKDVNKFEEKEQNMSEDNKSVESIKNKGDDFKNKQQDVSNIEKNSTETKYIETDQSKVKTGDKLKNKDQNVCSDKENYQNVSENELQSRKKTMESDKQTEAPEEKCCDQKPSCNESQATSKNNGKRNMLYSIVSSLWCALPERYNTRGRKLHAPQNARQAMGVLMARYTPDSLQIPSFPVYTRSGEVRVSIEHVPDADVRMSPRRGRLVRRFMRFVFSEVLRVRRRGMNLHADGTTRNNYYIVPTIKTLRADGSTKIDIDWAFLEVIYRHSEDQPSGAERPILWQGEEDGDTCAKTVAKKERADKSMRNPLLKEGETFVFDPEKYREAVVTPWYRNQDQPQFFLVAEICTNLTPDSAFPSATHTSFRHYYSSKYGVTLTQAHQPLLDVDHTSARLNLLTPRYVNRKGVALPVSSERTRRAKRDRLDQKQILVPELCRVHPFAAPLWFATVALPCVLYRINALLIADEIRRSVAIDVGVGIPKIEHAGFQWPPLDFGWSLAEVSSVANIKVLNADSEKNEKKKEEDSSSKSEESQDKDEGTETDAAEDFIGSPKEKTLNDILQEKEATDGSFEIGTWSNEMASSVPEDSELYDKYSEPLPPNLTFCTSAEGGANWCDPIQKPRNQFKPSKAYSMADSDCSYMSSDFDTDDSSGCEGSEADDGDTSGFGSEHHACAAMGVRIEYKTAHEAEAVDLERQKVNPAPQADEKDDELDRRRYEAFIREGQPPTKHIEKFHESVARHKQSIIQNGCLIHHNEPVIQILPDTKESHDKLDKTLNGGNVNKLTENLSQFDLQTNSKTEREKILNEIFPYGNDEIVLHENGQIDLESIERNKRKLMAVLKSSLPEEEIKKLECFSMVDVNIDSKDYVNEKVANIGFDTKESYVERVNSWGKEMEHPPYYDDGKGQKFDFDYQPNLEGHPGPSPSVILQALTMSNANDGINLERLETIGDSFLKFAITAYLYCAHPTVHEGKLSHMRSKQVSNLNLYRLGRNKRLGARMIASKFEPHDNWLPPCHKPPPTLHSKHAANSTEHPGQDMPQDTTGCFIPYNLITQHSIPDKSIADCVEALIGAYLLECGPRGALLFMAWLGIRVLPRHEVELREGHPYVDAQRERARQKPAPPPKKQRRDSDSQSSDDEESRSEEPQRDWSWPGRPVGSLRPVQRDDGVWVQAIFGALKAPPSPLLRYIADPDGELDRMLSGYDALEERLQYRFKDRSLLLQAMSHASHQPNRLTDCYQRLEFLGDAILDYLITRHLYLDPRRHSPGALTDLRSALVNNTIFATLAARHGFHKYFRHMSPGLNEVLTRYVKIQEENGHSISEEHYLIQEDELEQAEDVEVPKALGDLFESVAGAIFLDSGMSLQAVWRSYERLMGAELEAFSAAAPKSPVRELLEAEPDTAKFGKPERLADGRRVRVCVEVFGRGAFKGVGRNYRIAKGTAARCALRHLKIHRAR